MALQKKIVIKWLLTTLWITIGAGTIVLLVAAVRKKDAEHCTKVNISIKGVNNNFFVDEKDILDSVISIEGDNPVGMPVSSFNLKMMEKKLAKNVWIKDANLFFDNNEVLQIKVTEREPVARVFTTSGNTFYIDSAIAMLPLSDKFSARLPVFTGFPSDKIVLSKDDSSLLKSIRTISAALQKDSFCMALIDQVDITAQRNFEFIPKLGNNIIVFGDAKNAEEKLNKIKVFYKEILVKAGWNCYSVINVQYKNQVVAKRKGADDKSADSLRTIQMMQQIAANAERMASDSLQQIAIDNDRNTTDNSMIDQSVQRDENEDAPGVLATTLNKPASLPIPFVPKPTLVIAKPVTPVVKPIVKPVDKKPKPPINTIKKPVLAKPTVIKPFVYKAVAPHPVDVASKPKPKPVAQTTKPVTKPITKPTTKPIAKPAPKKKTEPNNDY